MIIAHAKKSQIAYAPEAISDIINKYTDSHSYVIGHGHPNKRVTPKTDIIHQHNLIFGDFKNRVIQYHSEPFRVDLTPKITKLVIAQYHATLKEYKNCVIVRNPIDLYDEKFIPKYQNRKIRIGYSPSTLSKKSIWADKGYVETVPILNNIKKKFNGLVEIDIIINTSLDDCLYRKSLCNIFIDEVKTPSYHRSGLEALALGIPTICSTSHDVEQVLLNASKSTVNPFINSSVFGLEATLTKLITLGIDELLNIGFNNRVWMQTYWDPTTIANEYIDIYKKELL